MSYNFLLIGIISLIIAIFLLRKYKFYKYKTSDMLFATKLQVFLGALVLAMFGIMIILYEILKL
ncbi:hypothetical protein B0A61_03900 [Flavobacterium aquatile LMG 4008 = ATCC 11947]|nr:hypothetical protein B0A61_03900 [Flavobacterium aquatile LMG 4008 = ATCC 11947]GEC77322.1 hypothetical protein FAQ01_01920 [Flavobacterium aquatile]